MKCYRATVHASSQRNAILYRTQRSHLGRQASISTPAVVVWLYFYGSIMIIENSLCDTFSVNLKAYLGTFGITISLSLIHC